MNYESYKTLDELMVDTSATEFRQNVGYLPTGKNRQEFLDWITSEAMAAWSPTERPLLELLARLVSAASDLDYDSALRKIEALRPDKPAGADERPVRTPAQAVNDVATEIANPLIRQLQEEHPAIAAKLTPEQLSDFAIRAAATVSKEAGPQ